MLIVALQDDIDNLFAIWDTVIDRFLGVNLPQDEAIKIIVDKKECSYEDAKSRADHPQPFSDIAKAVQGNEDYEQKAFSKVRESLLSNTDLYNAFVASISSALKEIPAGMRNYNAAEFIANRLIGKENQGL